MMRYLRNPVIQGRILKDPMMITLVVVWVFCVIFVIWPHFSHPAHKAVAEAPNISRTWEEGVIHVGYGTTGFDTKDLTQAIASLKPNEKIVVGDGIFTVTNNHETASPMQDVTIEGTGNTVLSFEGEVQAYNLNLANVIVDGQDRNTALEVVGKSITLKNVTVRNTSNTGLLVRDDAQLSAEDLTFANVGQTCFKTSGTITATFAVSIFTGCHTAIELGTKARLLLDHASFSNADYGFYVMGTVSDFPICRRCTFNNVTEHVNSTGKVLFED
jgi:hypothetical protein